MKNIIRLLVSIFLCYIFLSCDRESNFVETRNSDQHKPSKSILANEIRIGSQIWMAKNLNVDRYRNGDPIYNLQSSGQWGSDSIGFWCYYNYDVSNGDIYGKLYSWGAVNDPRGLAPIGWHIPTIEEWETLANYLGGISIAGGKMKATVYWNPFNPNYASNISGFSALPGGYRASNSGMFGRMTADGYWWSSSLSSFTFNNNRYASNVHIEYFPGLFIEDSPTNSAYSVRCIKDQ